MYWRFQLKISSALNPMKKQSNYKLLWDRVVGIVGGGSWFDKQAPLMNKEQDRKNKKTEALFFTLSNANKTGMGRACGSTVHFGGI